MDIQINKIIDVLNKYPNIKIVLEYSVWIKLYHKNESINRAFWRNDDEHLLNKCSFYESMLNYFDIEDLEKHIKFRCFS